MSSLSAAISMVAAILGVTAGMLSPPQVPIPLDDEGRAELQKTLRTLFDANRLMREAKDLPAPARAIVRNAARSYFKVPQDYQGGNLIKEIMDRLNADLEPLGFVTHWDLGPANNRLRTEFYAFDRNSPQTATLKNGDLTGTVTLFSAKYVSGAPYYVYGFALHSKPIVFLMDDFIRSQSSVYRRHMDPKTNLEPLYGEGSSDVVRDILSEAFAGKSDADIAAIYRREIHDHEILHVWYNLLVQTRKTPDPGPRVTDIGEFAAYAGSPAFARYPYLQLLRHLEFLKTAERLELLGGSFRPIASAILRRLAERLSDQLEMLEDQKFVRSLSAGPTPLSAKEAAALLEALRRNGVTAQEIRSAFREIYEKAIGPLPEEINPSP